MLAMTLLMQSRVNTPLSCPGRSAARSDALQSRGPCKSALRHCAASGTREHHLCTAVIVSNAH
ncbi:hypothetical protein XH96_15770 [Bradyrhizobium sp. CCBAU 51765]|nr:hypothetical protein XH96_15770 [Bradyrhizobium sp. CCBAU 51765]